MTTMSANPPEVIDIVCWHAATAADISELVAQKKLDANGTCPDGYHVMLYAKENPLVFRALLDHGADLMAPYWTKVKTEYPVCAAVLGRITQGFMCQDTLVVAKMIADKLGSTAFNKLLDVYFQWSDNPFATEFLNAIVNQEGDIIKLLPKPTNRDLVADERSYTVCKALNGKRTNCLEEYAITRASFVREVDAIGRKKNIHRHDIPSEKRTSC